jgi:DNA polymerase-4
MTGGPVNKIIHVDMDAFYASVEQRDNPELRGKPVIVGGRPEERGVVATCSYEARKYGVHSAMAASRALQLCPQAVLVHPRFDAYMAVSEQIHEIFHQFTDLVEGLSLDEAYLDVTENKLSEPSATKIALEIKRRIVETTCLTASAGVSYNKFIAKAASGFKKPDGLTVVTPDKAAGFLAKLPISAFWGVGKVTGQRMISLGITNGADLLRASLQTLTSEFGKSGAWFWQLARGIDDTPVYPFHERQSVGREITLPRDTSDLALIRELLAELSREVDKILRESGKHGRTVTLKLKFFDFRLVTRRITLKLPVPDATSILREALRLLPKTDAGHIPVRLVGIQVSGFQSLPEEEGAPNLPFPPF